MLSCLSGPRLTIGDSPILAYEMGPWHVRAETGYAEGSVLTSISTKLFLCGDFLVLINEIKIYEVCSSNRS